MAAKWSDLRYRRHKGKERKCEHYQDNLTRSDQLAAHRTTRGTGPFDDRFIDGLVDHGALCMRRNKRLRVRRLHETLCPCATDFCAVPAWDVTELKC